MEFSERSPNASPSSLAHKIRYVLCFSCCSNAYGEEEDDRLPPLIRSSSLWIRSRAQELPPLMRRQSTHRHYGDGPFRYDPIDYVQNFDEGPNFDDELEVGGAAESRYRNFSVRIPSTSPSPAADQAVDVS